MPRVIRTVTAAALADVRNALEQLRLACPRLVGLAVVLSMDVRRVGGVPG